MNGNKKNSDFICTRSDSEDEIDSIWDSDCECESNVTSPNFAIPSTSGTCKKRIYTSSESDDSVTMCKNLCKKTRVSTSLESEDNDENAQLSLIENIQWTDHNLSPKVYDFDARHSGCKVNVTETSTILQYFQIFFSEELVSFIVNETNKFYNYVIKDVTKMKSRLNNWENTTVNEMYCFLAATMLMARLKKLSLTEYWSTDMLIKTDIFSNIMSRDRYMLLLRMLHFNDNDVPACGNRLVKIDKILDKLRTAFKESFNPYRNICIDEKLLLQKDKPIFKQYISSQRKKYGIKTFILYDCQSGYILDMIIYSGASTEIIQHHPEFGLGENIVMTLLQPYFKKNHTLYTNDWFTSPALFIALHNKGINACGKVKKNIKGLPKMSKKLKSGEMSFESTDILLALKWNNKREVWMLSTLHRAATVNTEEKNRETEEPFYKPKCILDYNAFMSAIYKTDMILSSIESVRKSSKWYIKMFFHLMDICIYNAYVLYKEVTKTSIPITKFHHKLIREILETYHIERSKIGGGKKCTDNHTRLTERHFPAECKNEKSPTKKSAMRRCVVCAKHGKRRESRYQCKICNVGLCIIPCFRVYHTIKNY